MGVGQAKGEDKARLAATMAIFSPLLSTSIAGATGVLISITASPDIQLSEIDLASRMVHEEAHPDANIIWGTSFDETMNNEIRITIIATGFTNKNETLASEKKAPKAEEIVSTPAVTEDFFASTPVIEERNEEFFAPKVTYTEPVEEPVYQAPKNDFDYSFEPTAPAASEAYTPAVDSAPAQDTSVKASCQEYEELFKCIRRMKK